MEGHLCVVVVERDGSGQTCAPPPLKATLSDLTNNFTAPITFGCAPSCTFRLRPTTGALERHAELRIERGKAVLYNLDSESRFVRVNKDAVSYHQPRSLEDGDTILLANGELCLQFGLPLDPPSSSSSPSLPSSYSSKLLSSSSSSNKENQQPQKNTTNPSFASSLSFSSSSVSCNVGNKGKIQRREHQHSSPDHSRRTTRVSSSIATCSALEEEINSPEDHNSHSGAMNGLLLPFCGKKEQQHKASLPSLLPPTAGRGPQTRDIGEMNPKQLMMIMEEQQQDEQWDRASSALAAMASYKARCPSTPSPSSALHQLEDHEEQDDEEEHDDDGEAYEESEHSSTSTLHSVRKEDDEHHIDYYDENDEIGEEVDEEEDKAWTRTKTRTTINNGSYEKSDVGPLFTTFRVGVSDVLREGMTGEFSIVRDPKSGALNFVLKIPTALGYGSPASSNNLHYHNSRKASHSFSDNKEDQKSVIPSVDEMKCTEQHQAFELPTKGNSDETATTTTASSLLTPRRSKRLRSSTLTTSTTNSTKNDMPSTKRTRPNNSASKKNATMTTTESTADSPTNARRPFKKRSTVRRGTHLRKDDTKEREDEVEEGGEEELLSNEVNAVGEEEEEGDEEERKNTIRTRRRSDTQEQSWMPTERKTKSVDRKGTLLWSAERVLREEGRPMKAPEIVAVGRRKGYIDTDSKRAANSLVGRFSTSIRQDPNSPFVRLSPATYGLKEHMEFYRLVRQGASSPN